MGLGMIGIGRWVLGGLAVTLMACGANSGSGVPQGGAANNNGGAMNAAGQSGSQVNGSAGATVGSGSAAEGGTSQGGSNSAMGDGGTSEMDTGRLSCDEARSVSGQLLSDALENDVDHRCETPEDCVTTYLSTDCNASCGIVVSKTGEQQLAVIIGVLNASACYDFESRCGPVLIPPCVAPAPIACVDNLCVEDYGEPTP